MFVAPLPQLDSACETPPHRHPHFPQRDQSGWERPLAATSGYRQHCRPKTRHDALPHPPAKVMTCCPHRACRRHRTRSSTASPAGAVLSGFCWVRQPTGAVDFHSEPTLPAPRVFCVCACVRVCVRARVRVCVCMCMCMRARVRLGFVCLMDGQVLSRKNDDTYIGCRQIGSPRGTRWTG